MRDWFIKTEMRHWMVMNIPFPMFCLFSRRAFSAPDVPQKVLPLEDYTLITSHHISLKPPGNTRSPEVLTDLSSYTAADYITGASSRRRHTLFIYFLWISACGTVRLCGESEGETREAPFYRYFCHALPWNIKSLPSDLRNLISGLLPRLLLQRLDI